ncbi:MAG: xanthine dehydrogenase family protein molybdopterin-binding subunit [Sphingomonadales bacterium]|nr:xanthine dehydrogenase family protein molybdopterin-binding subunit [Sphingomonadales bacterium]
MDIDRRKLLIGAAAGGGLLVAWQVLPRHYPDPLLPGPGETALGPWLRIGKDGTVTVSVPQLEMGQGVQTVLAQVVAVELGADWRKVAVQPAPPSELWPNPVLAADWADLWMPAFAGLARRADGWLPRHWAETHRFNATAEGTALAAYEQPLREAAATARALLAKAAAARWDVPFEQCEVKGGFVSNGKHRLPIGDIADEAADQRPPSPPPVFPQPAFENPAALPPGAPLAFPRLDLAAKATGSAVFAGDVRLPDMVHAAIRHAPLGAEPALGHYDPHAANGVPGFLRLVPGPDWLAAVATDWWAAERALGLIAPKFAGHSRADSLKIDAALDKALRSGEGHPIATAGDADAALHSPATVTLRYDVAPALACGIETAAATARWRDGRLELWVAAQAPEQARRAVAAALGIPVHAVILYPVPAGGGFDARLEADHAVEAALIARAVGKPVQLTWSRWQEMLATRPRPPVAAQLQARTDSAGMIAAWKLRAALPAASLEFGARLFDGARPCDAAAQAGRHADPRALAGAVPPYAIPALTVEHVPVATGLPAGRVRGNAHAYTAFFTETMVDELAARLQREPLSYRIAMLGHDPRLVQCLQRVSALAGWNGGRDGSGQGVACHRIGTVGEGGCIAAVAIARRDEGGVRVDKVSAVADLGRIVNVDIVRQQIEGGLVFGIGLALGCAPGYAQGLPLTGSLGAMALPLLADCPEIEVELVPSDAPAFDAGELGVAVAAPVIANALASATGLRFRRLPLVSED